MMLMTLMTLMTQGHENYISSTNIKRTGLDEAWPIRYWVWFGYWYGLEGREEFPLPGKSR
jgi:hypothetical protein